MSSSDAAPPPTHPPTHATSMPAADWLVVRRAANPDGSSRPVYTIVRKPSLPPPATAFATTTSSSLSNSSMLAKSEPSQPPQPAPDDAEDCEIAGAGDAVYGESFWIDAAGGCDPGVMEVAPTAAGPQQQQHPHHLQDAPSTVPPPKMLQCTKCSKHFRNLYSLEHHICAPRRRHLSRQQVQQQEVNGVRYYLCPACRKPFKWIGNLTRHYHTHTGGRFFRCEICAKSFFTSYQVKRHMNSHLGVRYKCTICAKPFTCKYSCTWHMRQHATAQAQTVPQQPPVPQQQQHHQLYRASFHGAASLLSELGVGVSGGGGFDDRSDS